MQIAKLVEESARSLAPPKLLTCKGFSSTKAIDQSIEYLEAC